MTSRNDMDRPATVLSASLGVVLIAVSIVLFLFVGDGDGTRYNIAWTEVEVAQGDNTFAAQGTTQTASLTTPFAQVSNVTVTMDCADTPGTPARPATVSWTLKEGSETLASGTAACASDDEVQRVAIAPHADVGSVSAGSASEAEDEAYDAGDNETRTFTLEFSYTRPAAPGGIGLPVGAPSINGGMGLVAEAWLATANEPGQEATR